MKILVERKWKKDTYTIETCDTERCWTVYRHISPSGKVYVGITHTDPQIRWSKGYGKQTIFGKAIKKYGWDNFEHEILFSKLDKKTAEEKEIEFIALYKAAGLSYNDANGGFCRGKQSQETIEKIRKAHVGKQYGLGHKLSEEAKRKIGLKNKGKIISEEMRERLRNHPNIKGNKNRRRTLYQLSKEGKLIATYETSYAAQEATGVNRCNISACCNNRLKHSGGFKWTYNYEIAS